MRREKTGDIAPATHGNALSVYVRDPEGNRLEHRVYHLTARGRSLRPVLEALNAWGLEHIKGTEARVQVPQEGR